MTQEAETEGRSRGVPPARSNTPPDVSGDTGMKALVLDGDVVRQTCDFDVVAAALRDGKRFWMELDERTPQADAFLADTLKIHPLAIEDVWNDIGLPKVEDFGDYVQIVMHGVREEDVEGT